MPEFLTDIKILANGPVRYDQGPVTDSYKADINKVIDVLNQVLATELFVFCDIKGIILWRKGSMLNPSQ